MTAYDLANPQHTERFEAYKSVAHSELAREPGVKALTRDGSPGESCNRQVQRRRPFGEDETYASLGDDVPKEGEDDEVVVVEAGQVQVVRHSGNASVAN
jgi:hypothetical protein